MNILILIISLSWAFSNIITVIIRLILRDEINLKHYILIDLIGSYVICWAFIGCGYLIYLISIS